MFWKLKRHAKHVYYRLTKGISYMDVWNLDYYIQHITYEGLKMFREEPQGHPMDLTEKEWDGIIDDMIAGWKLKLEEKSHIEDFKISTFNDEQLEGWFYTKEEEKIIKKAERLYKIHSRQLWQ